MILMLIVTGGGDTNSKVTLVLMLVVVTPKQEETPTGGLSPTFLSLERGRGLFTSHMGWHMQRVKIEAEQPSLPSSEGGRRLAEELAAGTVCRDGLPCSEPLCLTEPTCPCTRSLLSGSVPGVGSASLGWDWPLPEQECL